ncbi:oligosaccharyl transferase subunit ost3/OST6 [Ascosphaera acerosa]|nr:oligosaccharyl transferase subunit ost3/OST6 [Ascosphaera acerosa]
MRSVSLVAAVLAIATSIIPSSAATPSPRYTDYLTTSPKASLDLDEASYTALLAKPRDYFLATLFTARDPKFGCTVCKAVQPEYDLLARSWNKAAIASEKRAQDVAEDGDRDAVPEVVWGTLDFLNGRPVFQQLMLSSAPALFVFPPTTGPHAKKDENPFRYDFTSPMDADQLASLLTRALGQPFKPTITRPINYIRLISVGTTFLGLFTVATVLLPYLLPVLRNRKMWTAISLLMVLLFTSGHMFNHIRKVPYISGNGAGGISYFVPGFQTQVGMESQLVAAMYAVLSFATIILAFKAPHIADAGMQYLSVVIWGAIVFGMYSVLLSIFRYKNAGYPFWLPPF